MKTEIAGYCTAFALLIGVLLFVAAKMFEYILWSMFQKDVPWYLDVLGGVALNGATILGFVICVIARACGVEVPFCGG